MSEGSISKRFLMTVRGIVQGVGFRPFVYREAKRYGIKGHVGNTSEGVVIDAEGIHLDRFVRALRENLPPQARIDSIDVTEAEPAGYDDFEIAQSLRGEGNAPIPLDTALCGACEQEMRDPSDRRHNYPFINCTDCGPRYTIIQIPPYDRVRTSMKHFAMCDACRAEYSDPHSRRFHAEPISCPDCGPALKFLDPSGNEMEGDPIERAAEMLKAGKIIALKGVGGFHLMCDATSEAAVQELRLRKRRRAKPLAVMFGSVEQLEKYAQVNDDERALITGAVKPIVIVDAKPQNALAPSIAPGIGRIGVFLPYTPLHALLFDRLSVPMVATSANISDEPIMTRAEEILSRLGHVVDGILDHNRPIVNALDDSVVQIAGGREVMLRMGRGYAPFSLPLSQPVTQPLLAVGGHQKSAVALAVGRNLVLSGHIGDLGSIQADEYFERTVHTFKRFYEGESRIAVHDPHPLYSSTRYAHESAREHCSVQHHYAHILACMAECGLTEKVLGFAFDGTGYGENAQLWGGEVMIADPHTYERVGSLKPFALLGGEKAVKEPRRIALSLLFERYSLEEVLSMTIPTAEAFLPHEIRQLHHMWVKKLNAPMSSSMGRLFDAVASLGGFVQNLDYEGQGGMVMEGFVDESITEPFGYDVVDGVVDCARMIRQIVELSSCGDAKRQIASRFIATVVRIMGDFAERYPHLPIVIGGGVFQNRALMDRLCRRFASRMFYAQQRTPVNDGGIALGQAWWGIHNL